MEVQSPPREIVSLTGLRGIAAMGVVLYHFRPPLIALFPSFAALDPITTGGRLGVDLFFTLSGFILTYSYYEAFVNPTLRRYLAFLGLRLARIYPVHLFTLGLLALAVGAGSVLGVKLNHPDQYSFGDFFVHALLLHGWEREYRPTWNYPSWSISAEWFAYLLFPLAIGLAARISSARAAIACAAVTIGLQVFAAKSGLTPLFFSGQDANALVRISGEFLMGCFVARLFLLRPVATVRANWLFVFSCSLLLAGLLLIPFQSGNRVFLLPIFGVIVGAAAYSSGPPVSWLSRRPLVVLGELSYAMYMTHALVEMFGAKVFPMTAFAERELLVRVVVAALYAIAIFVAALVTYVLVEQPARNVLRGLTTRLLGPVRA